MRWELTSTGACSAPGIDPTYATQQEIKLRYYKAPNHFKVLCSDKLATALKSGGKPIVPMVERRNGGAGSSTSICEIAGIKDDASGAACNFHGQLGGGYENAASPSPWD